MKYHVFTLFPEMILQGVNTSILGRAMQQDLIGIEAVNIRDFTNNKHGRVDDYTYGGGAGMLMQAQPVFDACSAVLKTIPDSHRRKLVYLSPQGRLFDQKMAQELSELDDLLLLCGHYEGIDERALEALGAELVSVGDYVLTGGELPAMILIDAVSRLVPGVLGNEESAETESFDNCLLEYPQYSRPEVWEGRSVPKILLSGDHAKVERWRLEQSVQRTRERRPDLYERFLQSDAGKEYLELVRKEERREARRKRREQKRLGELQAQDRDTGCFPG